MKVALVGLVDYQSQEGATYYNYMAAAGITNAAVMVLLYVIVQKGFVSGLMAGSIK
jgi:ABC-type glycerol-3-phosphate transport system permease component